MIKNLSYFSNKILNFQSVCNCLIIEKFISKFSIQKVKQQFNIKNTIKNRAPLNSAQNLLKIVQYDIKNTFYQYSYVKKQVQNSFKSNFYIKLNNKHIQQHQKTKQSFHKIINTINKYPNFQVDNQSLKLYYKLINQNIHTKSNQLLQSCLYFSLITDKHAINSPIFIEFVKFYVKDFAQLVKTQLSIDLHQQNIANTIKLFFLRIFQRGFLPRKPSYVRNLYINNHIDCLNYLIKNESTKSSLMLRKVFFQYFITIKEFYTEQMKENLYHQKNIILFKKLSDIINIMAMGFKDNIKSIELQNKYLRELYFKLFLVIQNLQHKQNLIKTIHTYQVVIEYLKQQKTIQNQQRILLQQYKEKAELLFSQLTLEQINNQIYLIELSEIIKILLTVNKGQIKLLKQIQQLLISQLTQRMSSIVFKYHFSNILQLINIYWLAQPKLNTQNNFKYLINKLQSVQTYQELQLNQISIISQQIFTKNNIKLKQSIIKSVLSKNITLIGNQELWCLLKIYQNTFIDSNYKQLQIDTSKSDKNTDQLISNRTILLNFILRFISDHHKTGLKFDNDFQQILKSIFISIQQNRLNLINHSFNDPDNNYPINIAQQMKQFLIKYQWRIKCQKLKHKIRQIYLL